MGVSPDTGWQSLRSPRRSTGTSVRCPACSGADLTLRLSCLATFFVCPACSRSFDLGQLLRLVPADDLEHLAHLVEDRLSDRL
jgi:hypothetical protein